VGDNIFGDLHALSDSILRCAGTRRVHLASQSSRAWLIASRRSNAAGVLEDIPLSHWEQLVGLFDVRDPSVAVSLSPMSPD
jgi:hypothetical protein